MGRYAYSRLSAQDNDFLRWESLRLPMHGVGVQVFENGPLAREGGVCFEAIREAVASALPRVARYRQKLAGVPGSDRAVWVDDTHFQLDHHLRHVALPHPGTEEQLRRLVAHVAEYPLDRGRPLWESWVVEGLTGGRFAYVTKAHHCMFDGAGGMSMISQLLSADADAPLPEPPRFLPSPPPSAFELRRAEWAHWATLPLRALQGAAELARRQDGFASDLRERLSALGELARFKLERASDTPLNGPVGPHRIVNWTGFALEEAKQAAHAHDASLNDFVLALLSGALRTFLSERGVRPEQLEFRASCPVNVRKPRERDRAGNFVSSWVVPLPLGESDPLARLRKLRETTRALKERHIALGIETVNQLHEWLPIDLQALSQGTQNVIVTNVPGPQHALHLRGARMQSMFALAPLIANVGLTIAAVSYDGKLCFGFNADEDRVPDLHEFVRAVRDAFAELVGAAGAAREAAPRLGAASAAEARGAA
jgi:WS/DGAT/MGAT family acyltransferase